MAPHPGSKGSEPTQLTLDALVLLALLLTVVVLVAVAGAGPIVLTAAGTFVTGCVAMWLKARADYRGQLSPAARGRRASGRRIEETQKELRLGSNEAAKPTAPEGGKGPDCVNDV